MRVAVQGLSCLLLCRHVIDLPLPRVELRKQLWQKLVPKRAPMAADIDFKGLGERYQHHLNYKQMDDSSDSLLLPQV